MLTACKINRYSIDDYLDFNHPHQKKIRSVFAKFTEENILKTNYGLDGCSAPQYAFTIKQLSVALSNLYKSYNSKFEYSHIVGIMIDAILKNPLFIGGNKNLDSNLIRISNGEIFCKGGAEGVFLFIHLKKGIFGILKVIDGNERVLPSVVYNLFKKLKLLKNKQIEELKFWNNFILKNHANIKIGHIKTVIE